MGQKLVLLCLILLGACTPQSTDEEAIRAVIAAEGAAIQARDIDTLATLWIEDGEVRDARHTPNDPTDDIVWRGRDAILTRYTTQLFWLTLDQIGPTDLEIHVKGDQAIVTGTTTIGEEISPQGERWTLVRIRGQWRIKRIVYNLEPPP